MTQRLNPNDLSLDAFRALISAPSACPPRAANMDRGVPIYHSADLAPYLDVPDQRKLLLDEWADVLLRGAGVFAIAGALLDTAVLDRASKCLKNLIKGEREGARGGGDHFAAAGNNDRLWNSLEKHALADPENFAAYYANPWIDAAAEAWLGPRYQMTAQVNLVHPGGQAQRAHRDYHLGFMTQDQAAQFPAHVHELTAALTLQGAMAHVDMPLKSGPTKVLPHSQKYPLGYLAFHEDDFAAVFEEHCVQIPLAKGDLLWFNPALFHAAGANKTQDIERLVNLFQVSSAFGRPMEAVDRRAIVQAVEPYLPTAPLARQALIRVAAQGYSFPTNLDVNPPVHGLAPQTDQDRLL